MFLPENSDPELWCGMEWASLENSFSSALLPGERVVGNLVATKASLSLPWPWRWQTMGMYSSQVESRLLHPSICPSNLKPPKEACLLCLGPHDEVPSFWLNCSLIKASIHPCNLLFLLFPSQRHRSWWIAFLPFLPEWISFSYSLGCTIVLLSFPVSFQWELFHM